MALGPKIYPNGLGIKQIINVTVIPSASLLSSPNPNNLALFSTETPTAAFADGYKIYKSYTQVATDFGSTSKAAKIAQAVFAQSPNILTGGGYLAITNLQPAIPAVGAAPAVPAETLAAAITRADTQFAFSGIISDTFHSVADATAIASLVQSTNKIVFGVQKDPATTIFNTIKTGSNSRYRCLFYQSDDAIYMQAAYASRALSTNFSAFGSTQTMELKSLATITPDLTIDSTFFNTLKQSGADVYSAIEGVPVILTSGKNKYFDQVYNLSWLIGSLQTNGFNYLRSTNSKIPQTISGIIGLKNAYRQSCDQAVFNGYIAPGTWTSSDIFGDEQDFRRSISERGYYIYATPLELQSATDRENRKAPVVQIALKESGALHSSDVIVNLNA